MTSHANEATRSHSGRLGIRALAVVTALLLGQGHAWARAASTPVAEATDTVPSRETIERGRYVVLLSHCNNCHTAGYSPAEGNVPEERWLMGNPVGWRGRKGTTYAANLRLYFRDMRESTWLQVARLIRTRPPMPWWTLRDTSDGDLKAMYWYIRSLQPVGDPAPDFLPAGQVPSPPYSQMPDLSIDR